MNGLEYFLIGCISGIIWTVMTMKARACIILQKKLAKALDGKGMYVEAEHLA